MLLDYFQTVTDTFRESYDGSDIETTLGQEVGGSSSEQYTEGGARVVQKKIQKSNNKINF